MPVVLAARPPIRDAGRTLLVVVAIFGLGTIGFGLSRVFVLSLLLYGGIGAADQVSMVIRQTILQVLTPDALRGRVSAGKARRDVSKPQRHGGAAQR